MKVALVTTPPSIPSEIGESTQALLPHLRRLCDLEIMVAREHAGTSSDGGVLCSADDLSPKRFDHILYQLGNEEHHAFMAPMVRELGGTVVQHDWTLYDMTRAAHPGLAVGGPLGLALALREGGVREARIYLAQRREQRRRESARAAGTTGGGRAREHGDSGTRDPDDHLTRPLSGDPSRECHRLALNRSIVRGGDSFIVHSRAMKERILVDRNAPTPIAIVQHGAERAWHDEDRALARARLGLPDAWAGGFLISSLRTARGSERIDRVLEALALVRRTRADVYLTLVGASAEENVELDALVRRLGLMETVRFTGPVSRSASLEHLHAADVCIHLPGSAIGGSSAILVRALSVGRPVITGGLGESNAAPDSCCSTVEPGAGEVQALARLIAEQCSQPDRRREHERAARAFVDEHCHWSIIARQYVDFLETCPAPRSKKKSLIKVMLEASERRRAEDAASPG